MSASTIALRLRVQVCDHTLAQAHPVPDAVEPVREVRDLDEMTGALHQLLVDDGSPMSVMDIAHRLSLPRVVVSTGITHLSRNGLVAISPLRPSPAFLRQAITTLAGDRPRLALPGLASAKVIVTGPSGAGVSTFVGAATSHTPARLPEVVPNRAGELTSYNLEQGAVEITPNGRIHLLAAPPPRLFDALWVDVTRAASALLIVVSAQTPWTALPILNCARETGLPFLVVINHIDGSHPDTGLLAHRLGADPDLIHITDARSRPATRSTLARILHQVETRQCTPTGRP